MRERYQLFFRLRLVSKESHHSAIQTKIELHFGGFFHQMKVRQPIGRQDSMQTVIRTSRRLESFLYEEAAQIFELLIKNTNCGWCPLKGLTNDTALMQIQSGRTVPLKLCWLGRTSGGEASPTDSKRRVLPHLYLFIWVFTWVLRPRLGSPSTTQEIWEGGLEFSACNRGGF